MTTATTERNLKMETFMPSEMFSLSLLGHRDSIFQPTGEFSNIKDSEEQIMNDPYLLTPTAARFNDNALKTKILLLPLTLSGKYRSFYSVYVKLTDKSGKALQANIRDIYPDHVNLKDSKKLVKTLKASVGGATPIGIKADVEGSLSWEDAYTVDEPLVTGVLFNDGTLCWQFEKQHAQRILPGRVFLYVALDSATDLSDEIRIHATAFGHAPHNMKSEGFRNVKDGATKYVIKSNSPNRMSLDDYLENNFSPIELLKRLRMFTDMKFDTSAVKDLT